MLWRPSARLRMALQMHSTACLCQLVQRCADSRRKSLLSMHVIDIASIFWTSGPGNLHSEGFHATDVRVINPIDDASIRSHWPCLCDSERCRVVRRLQPAQPPMVMWMLSFSKLSQALQSALPHPAYACMY